MEKKHNTEETAELLIDTREYPAKSASIYEDFRSKYKVRFGASDCDYLINGISAIEVKWSPEDFWSSITGGQVRTDEPKKSRLHSQLTGLQKYQERYLVLVGNPREIIHRHGPPAFKTLKTWQFVAPVDYGVYFISLDDMSDFKRFLTRILERHRAGIKPLEPSLTRMPADLHPAVAILTSIPRIGVKKAKKLLEKFGSILNIITEAATVNIRDPEDLKVFGIAKKNAAEILNAFTSIYAEDSDEKYPEKKAGVNTSE